MEAIRGIALITALLISVDCRDIRRDAEATDPTCLMRGNWVMGTTSKVMERHEYGTHKDISDWKACDGLCKADSTCNFWSYSIEYRTCQLMDRAVEKGTDAKYIAGPVGCSRCEEDNFDYFGYDIGAAMTETWEKCQENCQRSDQCQFFTWVKKDASGKNKNGFDISSVKTKCHLKTSMAKRIKLVGVVSGRRDCPSRIPAPAPIVIVAATAVPPKFSCKQDGEGGCVEWRVKRLERVKVASQSECQERCRTTNACHDYNFQKQGSLCRLFVAGCITQKSVPIRQFYRCTGIIVPESCGWIKDGGCHDACKERISLEGIGHTEQSCRMKCQLNSNCGVFLFGKAGRPRAGDCRLYKYGAETSCKAAEYYKKDWAMYRRDCETATTAPVTMEKKTENPEKETKPPTGKCSKYAFDGRPNEWRKPLESLHAKSFYTKAECEAECKAKQGCNSFRIKKSADRPYGGCELYKHATISGEHTIDFEVYELVDCVISDMCTGKFQEDASKAGNDKKRPPPGTKCVGGCIERSGRWGKNFCRTADGNWGAECVPCSVEPGKCPVVGGGDQRCSTRGFLQKEGEKSCLTDSDCLPGTDKCCSDGCNLICTKVVEPTKRPLTLPPKPVTETPPPGCIVDTWFTGAIGGIKGGFLGRYFNVKDYQTCDQHCLDEKDDKCKSFTYSYVAESCQMLHEVYDPRSDVGFISGAKGCSGATKSKIVVTEAPAKLAECECDHGKCDLTDEGTCLKFSNDGNRWHCRQPINKCPDGVTKCFDHNGSKYYSQEPKQGC